MPDWGLTPPIRDTRPYELDPWWLEPGKVITDPIHGDIFITRLEQCVLDTPPMQRLRRVRQLGTTQLVYPGATHTRFAHSLGAVRVVQTLLDTVIGQRNRSHEIADLFKEWEQEAKEEAGVGPTEAGEEPAWLEIFRRRLGEVTVLARLGALLHDICHVPFGHTIEDDLRLLTAHDQGEPRFLSIWREVLDSCKEAVEEKAHRDSLEPAVVADRLIGLAPLREESPLFEDLKRLILSSEKDENGQKIDPAKSIRYPFVADMVGNTICADLLDYLQRDHTFTGLPLSLGRRYLSYFYITPSGGGGLYRERMALLIHRDGRERKDVVTEILKHLRYRYELQERVLVHHTKLAADAMVGKMFELWLAAERRSLGRNPARRAKLRAELPEGFEFPGSSNVDEGEQLVRWELEKMLLRHGDDGVLEHLSTMAGSERAGAATLAKDLLDRKLYKLAANAAGAAAADDLHAEFGSAEERRRLEREACWHAEIEHDWHVVLWIPDPDMRLKLAELLVNDGKGVAKFKDKSQKGSDIYAAHKELWTISVFVHPSVTTEKTRAVLAKLGQHLGVYWDAHADELGSDPAVAPEHLAAIEVLNVPAVTKDVESLISFAKADPELAARGGHASTQAELTRRVKAIAQQHHLLDVPPEGEY